MNSEFHIDRDVIRAISSETRIKILRLLSRRRMTLSELSTNLNLSKSTIRDNLSILINAGLVRSERSGKWVYYEVTYKGRVVTSPIEQERVKILIVLGSEVQD